MSTPVAVLLSEVQLATLKQLVDTFAPEVARDDDPSGFWARRGSDLGVDAAIAQQLSSGAVPEADVEGIRQLLDALNAQGFDQAPQPDFGQYTERLGDMANRWVKYGVITKEEAEERIDSTLNVLNGQLDKVRETGQLPEGAYLELFVKVDANWQSRPKALERLGY